MRLLPREHRQVAVNAAKCLVYSVTMQLFVLQERLRHTVRRVSDHGPVVLELDVVAP